MITMRGFSAVIQVWFEAEDKVDAERHLEEMLTALRESRIPTMMQTQPIEDTGWKR